MATYGIMRVEKRKMAACGGLQVEHEREEGDAEKKHFDRSDIDWTKTRENEVLVSCGKPWVTAVKERAAQDGFRIRQGVKDRDRASVVALDALYTASPEWYQTHTKEEAESYFRACLAFHVRTFCQGDESRVLSAVVHWDEATPHMHMTSIPLVSDGTKVRLSAKDLMGGKEAYRARQQAFFDEVTKSRGMERGELQKERPEEKRLHLSVQDFKLAKNEELLRAQERQKEVLKQNTKEVVEARDIANRALGKAQLKLQEVEKERGFLSAVQVQQVRQEAKPVPFKSDRVQVDKEGFSGLVKTAALVEEARKRERKRAELEKLQEQKGKELGEREKAVAAREEAVKQKEALLDSYKAVEKRAHELQKKVLTLQKVVPAAAAFKQISQRYPDALERLCSVVELESQWEDLRRWHGSFGQREYTEIGEDKWVPVKEFSERYRRACQEADVEGSQEILKYSEMQQVRQRDKGISR